MSESVKLDDLVSAICRAAVTAQEATEQQHIRQLRRYFKEDGTPHVKVIRVPDARLGAAAGTFREVSVPLVSLISPTGLRLSKLGFEFQAGVAGDLEQDPEIVFGERSGVESTPVTIKIAIEGYSSGAFKDLDVSITPVERGVLSPPTDVTVITADERLVVRWVAVPGASAYEVEVLENNTPLVTQPDITYSETSAEISRLPTGAGVYQVRVRGLTPTSRQVLVNGDALNGMSGWKEIESGGEGWSVEDGPADACPATAGGTNFVTSSGWCKKAQLIDLVAAGFSAEHLDREPEIRVADWICSRSDCQGQYRLVVELRDANQKTLQRHDTGVVPAPLEPGWVYPWTEISRLFRKYGGGVRFVYFEHSGKDTKNWRGHYGAKMTGASVKVQTVIGSDMSTDVVHGSWSEHVAVHD